MKYADILNRAIKDADLNLAQVSRRVSKLGVRADRHYLCRLQNGKSAPASDKLNDALAQVLDIDPIELKAAAYREKIPAEILEKLQENTG